MDESFEEPSLALVLPIPEIVPEKPMEESKNSPVEKMMPHIINNIPIGSSF
jgi:hypothetical protein